MGITFETINPLNQVVDFINCLPAIGIFCTVGRSMVVEGLPSKILMNDTSDHSEDAHWTRTLSIPQKVEVLKDYGKICSLGTISGVATIALFIALTVLGVCPLMVGVIFCVGGAGLIAIGAVQIHRINNFIRTQNTP